MNSSSYTDIRQQLMQAALSCVESSGWSDDCFRKSVDGAGIDPAAARGACPRGALDLAIEFHRCGDKRMLELLRNIDLSAHKFRDRIGKAVWVRLEADANHKFAVRCCTALFANPIHSADGARLMWGTADQIWTELGDESSDLNWYTKRATLSMVLGTSIMYWLGDASHENFETQNFIERRIEDVMRFEQFKSKLRKNPLSKPIMTGFSTLEKRVRAPRDRRHTHPGHMSDTEAEAL